MFLETAKPQGHRLASAAVFLSAALWGLFWVPIRHFSDNGINGEWAIFLLYLPALIVLIPYVAYDWHNQRRHIKPAILIGLFIGLGLGCYGVGILYTSVIRATLLFYLTPIWATLISMVFLREQPVWSRWIAIGLGVAGLVLLLSNGEGRAISIGDLLALLSGVFWAIGASIIKYNGSAPICGMSLFQFLFAGVFVVIVGNLISPMTVPDWEVIRPLAILLSLISLCMVLPAIFLLFWASQLLSPGRVGLLMMSEAVVAVTTAALFLPDETLLILQWVGGVLIVGASIVEIQFDRSGLPEESARGDPA